MTCNIYKPFCGQEGDEVGDPHRRAKVWQMHVILTVLSATQAVSQEPNVSGWYQALDDGYRSLYVIFSPGFPIDA